VEGEDGGRMREDEQEMDEHELKEEEEGPPRFQNH